MPNLPPVPTNETVPVAPPEPAPGASYGANLSTFLGSSPNGTWSLWALSDKTGDSGYISNGWILSISTGVAVEDDSDLEVTITTNTQPTAFNPFIYYVTVTNYGPSGATNLTITDYLPAGTIYESNSLTGALTNVTVASGSTSAIVTNGALYVTLASLPTNVGTEFQVYVVPTNVGYLTNIVTALALQPDPNSNNMITNVALVGPASANVAVSLSGSPDPTLVGGTVTFFVGITNDGPSDAGSVTNTISLPGFMPLTNVFTPTAGTATYTNGTVTWIVPDLPDGSQQNLTIVTKAVLAGTNLCTASTSYGVYDPLKGNSFSSVKIEVEPAPMLNVFNVAGAYELTWSSQAANYTLQGAITLPPPNAADLWVNIPVPLGTNGLYTYVLPGTGGFHFFRLSAPLP
jgi:uncharacterized repeat protein (TIGR01451 family)